ncbi:MAG: hypothetical protein EXQ49_05860 [Acidobacteria bacterium]|nr:hypothetical protein [Acidobacteriota bacterium]
MLLRRCPRARDGRARPGPRVCAARAGAARADAARDGCAGRGGRPAPMGRTRRWCTVRGRSAPARGDAGAGSRPRSRQTSRLHHSSRDCLTRAR